MAPHEVEIIDSEFSGISTTRQNRKLVDSILRVRGTEIVDGHGDPVILKGAGIGGHMNMENFITGFPGHEHEHRAAMLEVLGPEKYNFFFDKFLDYFFTSSDAKFLAAQGMNCVRIPFNYRHFEDDLNPGVIKAEGFRLLDRVVERCAAENLYVILDLHAVPGGQNQDWHSDSGVHKALFWQFMEFQDRMINLWKAIALHYKGNVHVAGYNPLNEPADPAHTNLQAFYARVEKAIRSVDPDHILFLDGNTYAMDFSHFETVLPNSVYAMHDYSMMGFPMGQQYSGTAAQDASLKRSFERKVEFMRKNGLPIWNGEFGPVYASSSDPSHEEINQGRYNLLQAQMKIYRETGISWSIWTYKDIGYQGMIYVSPNTAWMKLLTPFLQKKAALGTDFWGRNDSKEIHDIYDPLFNHLRTVVPEQFRKKRYPSPLWGIERHAERVLREMLMGEYLGFEMAELFRGKTFEELDELAGSFRFENCVLRSGLNEILKRDSKGV